MPPFLSPATASLDDNLDSRGRTSRSLAVSDSSHQLGGIILESSHSSSRGSRSFRHGAVGGGGGVGEIPHLLSGSSSGNSGDSLTMGEHCALVNEALAARTSDLLRAYRSKLGAEAALLQKDFYFASSAERLELQRLIEGYHSKLSSISNQFSTLSSTRSRIHKLRLHNASLRLFNLDAARNYDASLSDMRFEVDLLAQQVHKSPLDQLAGLENAIACKENERRSLEKEVAQAKIDVTAQRPRLEQALAESLQHKATLQSQLESFERGKEEDYSRQRSEIAALQERIQNQVATNLSLQSAVEKKRKANALLHTALESTRSSLDSARAAYENEVSSGVRALESLQTDLRSKTAAFNRQFLLVQTGTEICSALDARVRIDLICRSCMQLLDDPQVMWPCGHTLCRKCVLVLDAGSPELLTLPSGTPAGSLVCTECSYNFHNPLPMSGENSDGEEEAEDSVVLGGGRRRSSMHTGGGHNGSSSISSSLQHQSGSSSGSGGEDVQFPNPYFDSPPHFHGVFYAAPNKLLARMVAGYKSSVGKLQTMMPHFEQLSQSVDVFARYGTQTHQANQQAAAAAGADGNTRLKQLLAEAERRVDRGEMQQQQQQQQQRAPSSDPKQRESK